MNINLGYTAPSISDEYYNSPGLPTPNPTYKDSREGRFNYSSTSPLGDIGSGSSDTQDTPSDPNFDPSQFQKTNLEKVRPYLKWGGVAIMGSKDLD